MALTHEQVRKLRRAGQGDDHNKLKLARELAGLTQVQLAEALEISQSSLSDLERQRYGTTTLATARKFADFFGCAIDDLFPSKAEVA